MNPVTKCSYLLVLFSSKYRCQIFSHEMCSAESNLPWKNEFNAKKTPNTTKTKQMSTDTVTVTSLLGRIFISSTSSGIGITARTRNRECDIYVSGVSDRRYTEIPNRYPIFSNTDTDTDVGILDTENIEIPTSEYWIPKIPTIRFGIHLHGAVSYVTFETGHLNYQSYWPLMLGR